MDVKLSEWRAMMEYRRSINRANFDDIRWIGDDNQEIIISDEIKEEWHFIGLSNTDFPSIHLGEEGVKIRELFFTKDPETCVSVDDAVPCADQSCDKYRTIEGGCPVCDDPCL